MLNINIVYATASTHINIDMIPDKRTKNQENNNDIHIAFCMNLYYIIKVKESQSRFISADNGMEGEIYAI